MLGRVDISGGDAAAEGFAVSGPMFELVWRAEADRIGSPDRALADGNLVNQETGEVWRSYSMERDSEAFDIATRLPRRWSCWVRLGPSSC